jgi:hypothetical protein
VLSAAAALLHIAVIVGGAEWYRFFGAGEGMARLAERGGYFRPRAKGRWTAPQPRARSC